MTVPQHVKDPERHACPSAEKPGSFLATPSNTSGIDYNKDDEPGPLSQHQGTLTSQMFLWINDGNKNLRGMLKNLVKVLEGRPSPPFPLPMVFNGLTL